MNYWMGDFRVGKTVRGMWNSNAIAGESITRATNGTISVYKDGNVTQSTAGVTDTEDFDNLTGVHLVTIDTSADGTFYSAGSDFIVVLSAATIDGKTINAALFGFSLENRSALMPTTDGRKLDVNAGGEAGLDLDNTSGTLGVGEIPNLDAAISSRSTVTTAQVNTEVVDVIRVDTISELAQAAPSPQPTVATALMLLYMALRNEFTQTATEACISNNAGTVICKAATTDDGTTFTRAEWAAGP